MTVTTALLAEGKTKILRLHEESDALAGTLPDALMVTFKDTATAFNGKKRAEIPQKGELNATISALLFERLEAQGIPTCFLRRSSCANELIYQRLTMIPLEVVVRNFAYGSLVKRFGLEEGSPLQKPLVEFFYKSEDDPQISEDLILELNLVPTEQTLLEIKRQALRINDIFLTCFSACGIRCADFKLEFGFNRHGQLLLGDELSPDNFRLRDMKTGAVLDKDVFRLDLGDVADAYRTLLSRLQEGLLSLPEGMPHPGSVAKEMPLCSVPDAALKVYVGEVCVQSRKNILNPESKTILDSIHAMGYASVSSLNAGKRFIVHLEAETRQQAESQLKLLAENLLSNPVIEDYTLSMKDE